MEKLGLGYDVLKDEPGADLLLHFGILANVPLAGKGGFDLVPRG